TYSPWLFVATFAQAPFFCALLAMAWTGRRQTAFRGSIVGILAGLTFLAHTGPALILAIAAVFLLRPTALAAAGVAALVVASPFLYSIEGHYHLHVLNTVPMGWQWPPTTIAGFPATL